MLQEGGRNQPHSPMSSEDRTFRVQTSRIPSSSPPEGAMWSQGSLPIPIPWTTKTSFHQAHFHLPKSLPRNVSHKVHQHGIKSYKHRILQQKKVIFLQKTNPTSLDPARQFLEFLSSCHLWAALPLKYLAKTREPGSTSSFLWIFISSYYDIWKKNTPSVLIRLLLNLLRDC